MSAPCSKTATANRRGIDVLADRNLRIDPMQLGHFVDACLCVGWCCRFPSAARPGARHPRSVTRSAISLIRAKFRAVAPSAANRRSAGWWAGPEKAAAHPPQTLCALQHGLQRPRDLIPERMVLYAGMPHRISRALIRLLSLNRILCIQRPPLVETRGVAALLP